MIFSSTVFLFLFLPVVISGYYLTPTTGLRNILLLVASLFFYAWGENSYILLMLFSITVNYSTGLLLGRQSVPFMRKTTVIVAICVNLLLLIIFKYSNFIADGISGVFAGIGMKPLTLAPVHLPIGISFFTFQAISYIVDVYRGDARVQTNPLDCGLYIALFPQLIAGPIVRYHDIHLQISERTHTSQKFVSGVTLFVIGLSKKMIIANHMGFVADQIFALNPDEISAVVAWSGAFAYTLQIYFDFSGYSDMAIGLGRMFGFELRINFNYPYISRSFREFWKRWHISLSRWFRDYLYIPLGGNRQGGIRTGLNLFLVFFLCGLWHGAAWNFILWGLLHGFFLVVERGVFGTWLGRCCRLFQHCYLLALVMVTWVVFRAENLASALGYLQAMFDPTRVISIFFPIGLYWQPFEVLVAFIGIVAATPVFSLYSRKLTQFLSQHAIGNGAVCFGRVLAVFSLLILCSMELAAGTHNPFIYFRF